MQRSIIVATFGVLLSLCSVSSAGPRVFHNQTDFLNEAGPLSFEGFEGLPANNSDSLSSVTTSGFVVTALNSGLGVFNQPISGQYATEGTQFLDHQSGLNVTTTFTFNFAINSFGFDLIDYGDFGTGQLTLVNDAGDTAVVAVSGNVDGNVQYFGVISDFMFTTAILTNTISGEAFGFDKVSYGMSEPMVPTAEAGEDRAVFAVSDLTEVTLDGSDSNDPKGNELTYKWTWLIDGNVYEANGVSPTIQLPLGTHTIQLVVNNGFMDSQPDDVNITVIAAEPTADAGNDQIVFAVSDGIAEVMFNGSDSNDPTGNELTYKWTWTIGANTYEANGVSPTVELPAGLHTVQLIVNNGFMDSQPDDVNITVIAPVEAKLKITPVTINCRNVQSDIRACIELPYGVDGNAVDFNESFILLPGEIKATKQQISSGKILAFFDRAELAANILTDVSVEVIVEGKLRSGQCFYGTDIVRINH